MKMKKYVALIALIAIAAFFRLAFIHTTPPGLYPDEAMNGNNALESIETGEYKIFYPENNGREGFFINIQALFLKFFLSFAENPEPWMLRVPSALFGILTVLGLYFLARELFEKNKSFEIALFSSFFIATSFWHINFSRIGFRAIMAPCFLVWGIFLLLLAFRKWEGRNVFENLKLKIKNSLLPLAAGAVYGLGMHSYIAYRATPAIILFIFVLAGIRKGWKKTITIGMLFCVGAVAISLPLLVYFTENPSDFLGRTSQVSVFSGSSPALEVLSNSAKTIGMLFYGGDGNWRHNYPEHGQLFWPVAICFVIGVALGIKKIFNSQSSNSNQTSDSNVQNSKSFRSFGFKILDLLRVSDFGFGILILFVWIAVAMLPVVISNEGIPHALRSILMIPPIFIFAGLGASSIWGFLKRRMRTAIQNSILIVFAGCIAIYAFCSYFFLWGKDTNTAGAFTEKYVTMGYMIRNLPADLPKYIIVRAGGTDVRGIPMPAQTTMFITDAFTSEKQKEKNIFFILPEDKGSIPHGSFVTTLE
jgi:4-amino-4-deoxy-L-arabinose transferase-like glycosyltransferase